MHGWAVISSILSGAAPNYIQLRHETARAMPGNWGVKVMAKYLFLDLLKAGDTKLLHLLSARYV